ncbi:YugN family protein [Paenibacillus sp. y28]|uniref:YugN family protein n=1 Tax=Paenibacillus sp. y28 TaxID=3129110 RepID=UPI00301A206F
MIIEQSEVKGLTTDLYHLDKAADSIGFVRWQWEYNRATYDYKIVHNSQEFYLRVNTRVTEGKMESPDTLLVLEDAYIGVTTFPHGLDYNSPIPDPVLQASKQKLTELKKKLSA